MEMHSLSLWWVELSFKYLKKNSLNLIRFEHKCLTFKCNFSFYTVLSLNYCDIKIVSV